MLADEKRTLEELEESYDDALAQINGRIEALLARQDADMQHVIYQVEYQRQLKTQVQAILETLQTNEFETVSQYLTRAYENGFFGTMYDIHGQGIPLIFPIDQAQVVDAIRNETKLSENLYTALGHDIKDLQRKIAGEISRGMSQGMSYDQMARNIAAWARVPQNNAMRIARTEAHRIGCRATFDAQNKAKAKGADVVKQWDASLDGNTRPNHRKLDGQIREIDEPFEVGGMKAMYPGDFGDPAEDCNCRCALLQRARWALGAEELETLKQRAEVMGEYDSYNEFRESYNNALNELFSERQRGLSAKIGGEGFIPEHEEPKLMGQIDFNNQDAIMETVLDFERGAINNTIEEACVITSSGNVYRCYGVADGVYPDYDLNDDLTGAIISHNHPIEETAYSFSKNDLQLFLDYNLNTLRGCDEIYTYEFTRNADDVDEPLEDWFTEENYQHSLMIEKALEYGIGYRRWKNE